MQLTKDRYGVCHVDMVIHKKLVQALNPNIKALNVTYDHRATLNFIQVNDTFTEFKIKELEASTPEYTKYLGLIDAVVLVDEVIIDNIILEHKLSGMAVAEIIFLDYVKPNL